MYGSHRHSTWSNRTCRASPCSAREHGALVGERDVLVVRERVAGGVGQVVRRLVADPDHRRAGDGERPGEVGHLGGKPGESITTAVIALLASLGRPEQDVTVRSAV